MEIPPTDLLPLLEKAPNVVLKDIDRIGTQAMIRPNHLIPPFDNPKARQALLYIVGDQKDTLSAMVGRADLEVPCWADQRSASIADPGHEKAVGHKALYTRGVM